MRQKKFLLVDDDAGFLAIVQELFVATGGGKWEVFTAQNHAQALELLQKERVDLVVLDIGMPIMDGFQFTKLLSRAHPGQNVVMLTGEVTEEKRKACVEHGVLLLLEKPVATDGFSSLFATLDSLAGAQAHSGFRGMMRQVGLQEVIQMECLGRKSSLLEVFASNMRGRIYICDGSIIHAESGPVRGEAALYGLLALQDGEFNLSQFSEPPQRTIEGPWEFLLMEAARLTDEASQNLPLEAAQSEAESASMDTQHFIEGSLPTQVEKEIGSAWNVPSFSQANPASPSLPEPKARSLESTLSAAPTQVKIEEVALCSGSGELLYEWQCQPLEGRLRLLQQVEQQAAQVTNLITVGRFDRLEIITPEGRIVCHLQQDRRLFVRSSTLTQPAP